MLNLKSYKNNYGGEYKNCKIKVISVLVKIEVYNKDNNLIYSENKETYSKKIGRKTIKDILNNFNTIIFDDSKLLKIKKFVKDKFLKIK